MAWIDGFNTDATIRHAVMLLNGRCATTPDLVSMMQFQLERAFGKILGLGFAQISPGRPAKGDSEAAAAWPVMQPVNGVCGPAGGTAFPIPEPCNSTTSPPSTGYIPSPPTTSLPFPASC